MVDHCTFEMGDDGAVDITNTVNDVTVSWNFFHNNHKSQLITVRPEGAAQHPPTTSTRAIPP